MYRDEFFENRGARLRYRRLQKDGSPALLGLHGFGDTSGTFRFLEPQLKESFDLFFLDWRGHGDSSRLTEGYYNASMLFGDLSAFTGAVMPDSYFLMGHSMGAAAAARFAGLFPEEIRGLILFEGFSGVVSTATETERMRNWAQGLRKSRPGRVRVMTNIEIVRQTLAMMHPRMNQEQVAFFAEEWTRPAADGEGLVWHMDPAMRSNFSPLPFPWYLSRDLWNRIECPVLLFFGQETQLRPGISPQKAYVDTRDKAGEPVDENSAAGTDPNIRVQTKAAKKAEEKQNEAEALDEIISHFKDIELHDLPDCGHNIHHDNPAEVSRIMQDWLARKNLL